MPSAHGYTPGFFSAFQIGFESANSPGKIYLSGEGGLAFFDTGNEGDFPNDEFRVDEAKLFVDASVWTDVYFFTEVDIATREDESDLQLGELYLDFENISKLWEKENQLSLRAGRMDIPFGEEYLTRDAIDNPLISHSLSDLWGVDEGVEIYGAIQKARYVLAVQNGGLPKFRDNDPDKAVSGRISLDANDRIHLSFSAMRTGNLNVSDDRLSAMWFGNGFLRSLGSPETTTFFHGNFLEADGAAHWNRLRTAAALGRVAYDDNDTVTNNHRNVNYFWIESTYGLLQENPDKLHFAARFSRISSGKGFPLVGHGDFGQYFFDPAALTVSLWRLSLGVGVHFGKNALAKAEYTLERGKEIDGSKRNDEDFVGMEAVFKF